MPSLATWIATALLVRYAPKLPSPGRTGRTTKIDHDTELADKRQPLVDAVANASIRAITIVPMRLVDGAP